MKSDRYFCAGLYAIRFYERVGVSLYMIPKRCLRKSRLRQFRVPLVAMFVFA